jgi:RNA polymerase sigma-70 factor (ECF subfamily)
LWARAVDGDREAFGLIFDRHSQAVYNHLFRRTADWAEAEDLASAVFLHAWRRREEIVLDRDSALPWLLGVANRSLSNTRRRIRRAEALFHRLVVQDEPVRDHADEAAERGDDERLMSEVRRAVARLPKHERDVVELCVWSGLDQQAAATALGVAVGTVKSRLFRARKRLGAELAGGEPAADRGPRASASSRPEKPGRSGKPDLRHPVNAEEAVR